MTMRFQMPIVYAIGAFSSGTGNIRPGDKVRFYNAGGGLTPRSIYSDTDLTTPITQPLVADSAGRFVNDGNGNAANDVFLQPGLFKLVWSSSADVTIHTWDNMDPGKATAESGGIAGLTEGGTGATTAGGALANLGGASQSGLDTEIAARQALDVRVVVLESAASFIDPGHRLTLQSGVPVSVTDQTAKTTVYLSPYKHNRISLWDGSQWVLVEFDEVSQTLADTTKSPAGAATNSAYDYFAWLDSATPMNTRGPAWSNVTARGTGAGTSELEQIDGVWVNKQNITNGPVARAGRYMGSIVTNGSTQLAMMFLPAAATGGSANRLDVWNMYNRVGISSICRDDTDSWSYATATWRSANASTSNRITIMRGLNEEDVDAEYSVTVQTGTSVRVACGVGLDVTDAFTGRPGRGVSGGGSQYDQITGRYSGFPGLGQHFLQAVERGHGSGTNTWTGDLGDATLDQMALILRTRM